MLERIRKILDGIKSTDEDSIKDYVRYKVPVFLMEYIVSDCFDSDVASGIKELLSFLVTKRYLEEHYIRYYDGFFQEQNSFKYRDMLIEAVVCILKSTKEEKWL